MALSFAIYGWDIPAEGTCAKGSLLGMEPSRQNALAWRDLGDIYSGLLYLEDAIDAYRQALQEAGVPASPLAFSEAKKAQEKVARRQE